MNGKLALVRHGQSEGNARNVFTGWSDLPLIAVGIKEAHAVAQQLTVLGFTFDLVYCSALQRAQETAAIIVQDLGLHVDAVLDVSLNERDYGELTGMNKQQAAERFGADQIALWRRSYLDRPPGGESLKDCRDRVDPFFDRTIKPQLDAGRNVLVVAHGNSLRALVMSIENLSPEEIQKFEIATGEIVIPYREQ
ncbi:2,3-bisphosphoglycerate-dependent phosphoglycerate mutase (plasmid) [Rhizobium lusitanum]|nr:2,3-bisphosphoglycerate-dependent phosphoglycerate mutase [Rhizobium lusitanum]